MGEGSQSKMMWAERKEEEEEERMMVRVRMRVKTKVRKGEGRTDEGGSDEEEGDCGEVSLQLPVLD